VRALPYAGPPPPCATTSSAPRSSDDGDDAAYDDKWSAGDDDGDGAVRAVGLRWAVVATVSYRHELTYVNFGSRTFWGIVGMTIAGVLASLFCAIFILRNWSTKLLRLAQRSVMGMICGSVALLHLSLLLYVGPVTQWQCQIRTWTFALTTTALTATLVLKARRRPARARSGGRRASSGVSRETSERETGVEVGWFVVAASGST
jgi:hypothetical protein